MIYEETRGDLEFLNPHEMEKEEPTEPQTLQECMDYAKKFDDFIPLENAIYDVEKKIKESQELLKQYIDECGQMTNGIIKSRFNKILNILKK